MEQKTCGKKKCMRVRNHVITGIFPETAYDAPNRNILTHTKDDGGRKYVFVYNMMYQEKAPVSFRLKIRGTGRLYRVDCWNAEAEEIGCFTQEDGYTQTDVTMAPGAGVIYVLDTNGEAGLHAVSADCRVVICEGRLIARPEKNGIYRILLSDGTERTITADAADDIEIPVWNLTVEDWNEGERKEIIEDRWLSIVTHEFYYETEKTPIEAGETELKSWREIPAVGEKVSGVGYYTAKVSLPENWSGSDGAYLKIGFANKCSVAVYVNGQKARAVDIDELTADVSEFLVPGENEIRMEVSSTLNNRLIARGYYEMGQKISMQVAENANNANMDQDADGSGDFNTPSSLFDITYRVRDYGITGGVKLVTYKKMEL